eukprot:772427_1
MASSINDLKTVLRENLASRGVMQEIKSKIRAEAFHALEDEQCAPPREVSDSNILINELIREYLEFNGYQHTQSVFIRESGSSITPTVDRHSLADQLHVKDSSSSSKVPLLYGILASSDKLNDPESNTQIVLYKKKK